MYDTRHAVLSAFAESIVLALNALIELDPVAVSALVNCRVPCNEKMLAAVHAGHKHPPPLGVRVSCLSLLNFLVGLQLEGAPHPGHGYIIAVYDGDSAGDLLIKRFENYGRVQ